MTERELFRAFLIETNKEESPVLHLEEFNYYANKAISNLYDSLFLVYPTNQKVRDYLKSLKRTIEISNFSQSLKGYKFDLPSDYRHLQKLEVFYKVIKPLDKCVELDKLYSFTCKVLEPDQEGSVNNDYFYSPGYRINFKYNRPYYSLTQNQCELLLGDKVGKELKLEKVRLDYLKQPKKINLDYFAAFEEIEDVSEQMEFDEITNKKILDELVKLVFEKTGDPRVSGHLQVNTAIPLRDTINDVKQ